MSTVALDHNPLIGEESQVILMTTVAELNESKSSVRPRGDFFDYLATSGLKPEKAAAMDAQK